MNSCVYCSQIETKGLTNGKLDNSFMQILSLDFPNDNWGCIYRHENDTVTNQHTKQTHIKR